MDSGTGDPRGVIRGDEGIAVPEGTFPISRPSAHIYTPYKATNQVNQEAIRKRGSVGSLSSGSKPRTRQRVVREPEWFIGNLSSDTQ